mgnify:CR=1 FL=1
MGDLKFVVPKPEETFGNLAFAGKNGEETAWSGGLRRVVKRTYSLFSDRQRADSVEVSIPGSAGEKLFAYEEPVKLVNPRITAGQYRINNRNYVKYMMEADDLVSAAEQKQENK